MLCTYEFHLLFNLKEDCSLLHSHNMKDCKRWIRLEKSITMQSNTLREKILLENKPLTMKNKKSNFKTLLLEFKAGFSNYTELIVHPKLILHKLKYKFKQIQQGHHQ